MLEGTDLDVTLARVGILRERLVDQGPMFTRRTDSLGRFYFVNNPAAALSMMGAAQHHYGRGDRVRSDDRAGGAARVRPAQPGRWGSICRFRQVHLSIAPAAAQPAREQHHFYTPAAPRLGSQDWQVRFVKGGAVLPPPRTISRLASWTMYHADSTRKELLRHGPLFRHLPGACCRPR